MAPNLSIVQLHMEIKLKSAEVSKELSKKDSLPEKSFLLLLNYGILTIVLSMLVLLWKEPFQI